MGDVGSKLLTSRPEALVNFDFKDILRGQSYIEFFAESAIPGTEAVQTGYDENDDGNVTNPSSSGDRMCQTFTLAEETWIIGISLKWDIGDTGTATVKLEDTTGGEPNNNVLDALNFTGLPTFGDAATFIRRNFNTPRRLDAGTYALVIPTEINNTRVRADLTSPEYTGGSFGTTENTGATWSMDTGKDMMFRIYGYSKNPFILFPTEETSKWTSIVFPSSQLIATETLIGKTDFDLEVGKSMLIEGRALADITWKIILNSVTGAINEFKGFMKISLKKWNGITETLIGSTETETIDLRSSSSEQISTQTADIMSIECVRTNLKKGDVLRLTVEALVDAQSRNGTPPNDSQGDSMEIVTFPTIKIPFKADI